MTFVSSNTRFRTAGSMMRRYRLQHLRRAIFWHSLALIRRVKIYQVLVAICSSQTNQRQPTLSYCFLCQTDGRGNRCVLTVAGCRVLADVENAPMASMTNNFVLQHR
jgi:hypothetical protein